MISPRLLFAYLLLLNATFDGCSHGLKQVQNSMADKNIVETEDRIIQFREGRNARIEYVLPGGGRLVDDMEEHQSVRSEMRPEFDWNTATPRGRELNEKAAQKRVQEGGLVYVIRYQDRYSNEGFAVETRLRLVEEHNVSGKVRSREYDLIVPTPEHLRGITIEKP
jgi:hypothetical protein